MDGRIADFLERMAQQLGVAVEYLWPAMVQYTRANAITALIINGVMLVVVIIAGAIAYRVGLGLWHVENRRWVEAPDRSPFDKPDVAFYVMGSIIPVVVVVGALALTIVNIATALPALISPEGATIMYVLKASK